MDTFMRKKLISLTLAMVICTSLLAGCGVVNNTETTTETITQEQSTSEEEQETEGESDTEDMTEADAEEKSKENTGSGSSDVTAVEATLEKPAQIGEWVETMKYSAQDSKDHPMYFKITGVIRGNEAQKIVDEYNAEGNVLSFRELEQDDLEYCVVTYESYFPTDFPEAEWGITDIDVDLSLCDLDDSGAIAGYIGLSTVWDISKDPEVNTFYVGDTFTEGQAVFAMVKGSSEYLFNCSYYDDNDTEINAYIVGQ